MSIWCQYFREEILSDPMWGPLTVVDYTPDGAYLLFLDLLSIQLEYWRGIFCG